MRNMKMILVAMLLLTGAAEASNRVVRATDMGSAMWSDLTGGKLGDVVVEFRQGDELPVSFEAQGDLIETRQNSVSYVIIKKNFWLRLSKKNVEVSLDGTAFKKISDVLTGSIEAGASTANAINIAFKAFLK